MPTDIKKRRAAEKDFKDRNVWVEDQAKKNKDTAAEQESSDKDMQNELFENAVHGVEEIAQPIHKGTFRMPKLYKNR